MEEIKMEHFINGLCPVCGGEVLRDENEPYSMETKEGKIYLCPLCGEGVAKILGMIGVPVVIEQVIMGDQQE